VRSHQGYGEFCFDSSLEALRFWVYDAFGYSWLVNVGISYEVHNLKSFTYLDYKKIIDCRDWRLGRLSIGAWIFGSCNVCLCNFSICC
jgi:hypothetical protein